MKSASTYRVEALYCGSWIIVNTIRARSPQAAIAKVQRLAAGLPVIAALGWRAVLVGNVSGRKLGRVTEILRG